MLQEVREINYLLNKHLDIKYKEIMEKNSDTEKVYVDYCQYIDHGEICFSMEKWNAYEEQWEVMEENTICINKNTDYFYAVFLTTEGENKIEKIITSIVVPKLRKCKGMSKKESKDFFRMQLGFGLQKNTLKYFLNQAKMLGYKKYINEFKNRLEKQIN
ncbi:hypothetical protein [Clostridium botulinum]|uniref:Uncharacterized protein n=1 Tax=Clostridium botulinum B2 450 TaxID=1379739 RepID=A0A0D1AER5_CLOBO|nr:hypothetical protein [Clostridium botulinum]KIS21664.1 hypothetical protein N495_19910 [Clostridium botulinum B2 450]